MHYKQKILHSLPILKRWLFSQVPGLLLGWLVSPMPYIGTFFYSKFSDSTLSYICLVLTILLMASVAYLLVLLSEMDFLENFIKRNHPNENLKILREIAQLHEKNPELFQGCPDEFSEIYRKKSPQFTGKINSKLIYFIDKFIVISSLFNLLLFFIVISPCH